MMVLLATPALPPVAAALSLWCATAQPARSIFTATRSAPTRPETGISIGDGRPIALDDRGREGRRRSRPAPSRSQRTRPGSGRSVRRAAPTDTTRPTPAGSPSTRAHRAPTSDRPRSAPSRRSRDGSSAADHPADSWSGGTPRRSTPDCPGATGGRSTAPASSTPTARPRRPPLGRRPAIGQYLHEVADEFLAEHIRRIC